MSDWMAQEGSIRRVRCSSNSKKMWKKTVNCADWAEAERMTWRYESTCHSSSVSNMWVYSGYKFQLFVLFILKQEHDLASYYCLLRHCWSLTLSSNTIPFFLTIRDTNLLFGVRVSMKSSQNSAGSNLQKRCKEAQQKMGTMDMTPYNILSENLLNQIIRVLTLEQKKNSREKKW